MNKIIFALAIFLAGCQQEKSTGQTPATSVSLPIENGVFEPLPFRTGQSYTEFRLKNDGEVSVEAFIFDADSVTFYSVDDSYDEGGNVYIEMTDTGWRFSTTERQRKYLIDEENTLVRNSPFVKSACVDVEEESISGKLVEEILGDSFSWATSFTFSEGAIRYRCNAVFPKTTRVVVPEFCGTGCLGVASLGGGELTEWLDSFKAQEQTNIADGFYWLGLSMFFTEDGGIEAYSFFDHSRGILSNEGTWEIVEVNGEEILEMNIPRELKMEFGIREEASPMITKVTGTRFMGVKYESTDSDSEFSKNIHNYLNSVGIEDLKSAYINTL